jgi:hypothetical protein
LYPAFIELYICGGSGIVFHEEIDSREEKGYNRHEVDPLDDPIGDEHEDDDDRDDVPRWGMLFF